MSHALRNRARLSLRQVLVLGLIVLAAVLARPVLHLVRTAATDTREFESLPAGWVDDASRLNQTAVAEVWGMPAEAADPEAQLAQVLTRASAAGLRVSVAGARHSMGGHTIYPGGIVLDMLPWHRMTLDEDRELLTVEAGALWSDVLAYLDGRGRSVQVMQSDNSFSVGGSISVNCHGWQFGHPPIASTVDSFRLMRADGTVVRCSRAQNSELFSLVLGGYGLFGIILDVDLRVTANKRYRMEQFVVPTTEALATFDAEIMGKPGVEMVYARMNIVPDSFLEEVVISAFFREPGGEIPALSDPGMEGVRRTIFRASEGSDYGKRLRWSAETRLQPLLATSSYSRNQLLNDSAEVFQNRASDSTDILHEYFVPRRGVAGFIQAMQRIVPDHSVDLLNITIRSVNEDHDTILRYASEPVFAFVMLFAQGRDEASEANMQACTQDLIDAALEHEGRYYLPYRLHATLQQFHAAYPQAREFFELKRKYDPEGLFQNHFYLKYGAPPESPDSDSR